MDAVGTFTGTDSALETKLFFQVHNCYFYRIDETHWPKSLNEIQPTHYDSLDKYRSLSVGLR